jgi:hypothetical protein
MIFTNPVSNGIKGNVNEIPLLQTALHQATLQGKKATFQVNIPLSNYSIFFNGVFTDDYEKTANNELTFDFEFNNQDKVELQIETLI